MTSQCGTTQWMAPELCGNEVAILDAWGAVSGLQGDARQAAVEQWRAYQQTHKTVEYGMLVDIYAFGVMMFEILVHQAPWEDTLDVNDVLRKVAKGERPAIAPSYEAEAKCWCTLMRKCC